MRTIAAGVFKAKCLAIMDEVQAKREPVIVTKHGIPVAKLVPIEQQTDPIFGFLAGQITIHGDIIAPAVEEGDWEILR